MNLTELKQYTLKSIGTGIPQKANAPTLFRFIPTASGLRHFLKATAKKYFLFISTGPPAINQ